MRFRGFLVTACPENANPEFAATLDEARDSHARGFDCRSVIHAASMLSTRIRRSQSPPRHALPVAAAHLLSVLTSSWASTSLCLASLISFLQRLAS